ncbi:class I poly(R)-hydroxyalkanoic acid synthase [Phaeovulum vinaykumarii]|nr:class I poly(R)-hydroxyalkanoic acid synthase [Phaeovulum vinaykumarii]
MQENIEKIEELSRRLAAALTHKRPINPALEGPGADLWMKAGLGFMQEWMKNPAHVFETQVGYWTRAMTHYLEATQALAQGKLAPPEDPGPHDRRFSNPLWDNHPWFNFVKQQYLIAARSIDEAVAGLEGLDEIDRRRVTYFTRQIVEMLAPTNFLLTNPDALQRAVETEGESLVKGLENLVRDIEANAGDLIVSLADRSAFRVGENIATTEGAVVFRNELFELIQYAPRSETVHRTPLLIFPPWINKFYILDLRANNSLIRWIVEQGFTLFVVSWKNPDPSYAEMGMDDYVARGYLTAIDEVRAITGEDQINAVGYCIAGTTLSLTLSLLAKRGQSPVKTATFFTTLTDFSDQGEFTAFLQNDFVDGIEAQCQRDGVLSHYYMARTFSFLRSADLIYQPAVRAYMMGEAPPAFDLLYWNGDGTNLPARMAVEYLRGLCQEDRFAGKGFTICGETVRISDVKVPLFAVACEADHIAPWKASFAGVSQMGSDDRTFVLAQSGHIAGIINPPSKDKYGHYTSEAAFGDPDAWREKASFHRHTWWPTWSHWLARHSGGRVPARVPGAGGRAVLAPAPGTYVREPVTV